MAGIGIPVLIQIKNNKCNMKHISQGKPHIIQLRKTNVEIVSEVKIQSMVNRE